MQFDSIDVNGHTFQGIDVKTEKAHLLMIQANQGFLGCGYFSVETANKLGETVAIVTGVSSYEDCLNANVVALSEKAKEKGLTTGITGREALNLLNS